MSLDKNLATEVAYYRCRSSDDWKGSGYCDRVRWQYLTTPSVSLEYYLSLIGHHLSCCQLRGPPPTDMPILILTKCVISAYRREDISENALFL